MSAPYEQNQNPADKLRKIKELILALVPSDSSPIGNTTLRRELEARLAADGMSLSEEDYWQAHSALVAQGLLVKGQGRGGSVRLPSQALKDPAGGMEHASFTLAAEEPSAQDASDQPSKQTKSRNTQAASRQKTGGDEAQILSYRHTDKRVNNPEVGMVNPKTDPDAGKTRWAYDPHLDPALQFDPQRSRIEKLIDDALASGDTEQMKAALEELKRLQSPYLNWAGKAERTSFEVDTVSLHVHERIDPASILSAVRKAMKGEGRSRGMEKALQPGLFDAPFENPALRDAIDFYRHEKGWANRLIAGDSCWS